MGIDYLNVSSKLQNVAFVKLDFLTENVAKTDSRIDEILKFNEKKHGSSYTSKMSEDCILFYFKGKPYPYGYTCYRNKGLKFYENGPASGNYDSDGEF